MKHLSATKAFKLIFQRSFSGIALAVVTALAACGGKAADSSASKGMVTGGAAPMRVALLTSGPISDQGWNGGAYEGLVALRDSLGAKISNIQTKTPAEFEENFRQYGEQGYALVFGHGFEFQDAASRVAPSYPKTVYIVTSGRVTAPNLAGVSFAFEQASYQAGIIAGATTKSNVIGMIGGQELPPVKTSFAAFERGAKLSNPKVTVITSYVGNWDDVSAAKEQALAQIGRGVDVIFQNADAAGLGIFRAAKEKKIYVFGSNVNQNPIAPEVVLGSVAIDFPKTFLMIAREVQGGHFAGRVIEVGGPDNAVHLILNPQLHSQIPPQAIARADSVGKQVTAGTFHALDDLLKGTDVAKPIKP